jgi:hypothetical protein
LGDTIGGSVAGDNPFSAATFILIQSDNPDKNNLGSQS